jgi:hypothetical protein
VWNTAVNSIPIGLVRLRRDKLDLLPPHQIDQKIERHREWGDKSRHRKHEVMKFKFSKKTYGK